MNGASDQPEEFGVQPEQGCQEEPQSNADSTSDATASPEDSTSSAPHSRRVRRRMSAEHIRQIKRKRRRRKILIGVLVIVAALAVFAGAFVWSALHVKNELQQAVSSAQGLQQTISEADTSKLEKQTTAFSDHVARPTSKPLRRCGRWRRSCRMWAMIFPPYAPRWPPWRIFRRRRCRNW